MAQANILYNHQTNLNQDNLNQNNLNNVNIQNRNNSPRIFCSHCNLIISFNTNSNISILCNRCYIAYLHFYEVYSNAQNLNQNMVNHNDCLHNHFDQNHGGVITIQGSNINCSLNHHYNLNDIINALRATQNHMNFRNM
jgi:hypothetical protein